MALILLPDECELPNTATRNAKRKPDVAPSSPLKVKKSDSQTSLSSRDSVLSRASDESTASSKCSFAPVKNQTSGHQGRVRIAVGGM